MAQYCIPERVVHAKGAGQWLSIVYRRGWCTPREQVSGSVLYTGEGGTRQGSRSVAQYCIPERVVHAKGAGQWLSIVYRRGWYMPREQVSGSVLYTGEGGARQGSRSVAQYCIPERVVHAKGAGQWLSIVYRRGWYMPREQVSGSVLYTGEGGTRQGSRSVAQYCIPERVVHAKGAGQWLSIVYRRGWCTPREQVSGSVLYTGEGGARQGSRSVAQNRPYSVKMTLGISAAIYGNNYSLYLLFTVQKGLFPSLKRM